jgi:hypothetical protein
MAAQNIRSSNGFTASPCLDFFPRLLISRLIPLGLLLQIAVNTNILAQIALDSGRKKFPEESCDYI